MPVALLGWKLWYGDGTTARSSVVRWADCPGTNIQALMLLTRGDNRKLYGMIITGTHDPSVYKIPGSTIEKTGEWMTDEAFETLRVGAMEAPLEY